MSTCSWLTRWYHRRKRRMDQKFVLAMLQRHTAFDQATSVWSWFITLPGQQHWRCACAKHDSRRPTETP